MTPSESQIKWTECLAALDRGHTLSAEEQRELIEVLLVRTEPVAMVGNDYDLLWAGNGPIAPLIQRHGIKVGDVLYAAPPATPPTADQWQPIETAPRGSNDYCWMNLAWGSNWDRSSGNGMRWGDRFFAAATFHCLGGEKRFEFREVEVTPTHWMPLPVLPTDAAKGE